MYSVHERTSPQVRKVGRLSVFVVLLVLSTQIFIHASVYFYSALDALGKLIKITVFFIKGSLFYHYFKQYFYRGFHSNVFR